MISIRRVYELAYFEALNLWDTFYHRLQKHPEDEVYKYNERMYYQEMEAIRAELLKMEAELTS